jgi:uncharacterized damage-inducible protein DinB
VSYAEGFLKEFDPEMASTRRLLERLPGDRLDWRPHPKSRTLGELATHVAELPRWGTRIQKSDFVAGSEAPPRLATAEDFVARFDGNVRSARESIAGLSDEALADEFTVVRDGRPFFRLKKRAILRRVLMNHLIHHRGQLTVYLRQNDVPLPPVYGPTADETIQP